MVAKGDGLRALKMGVAAHDRAGVLPGLFAQDLNQLSQLGQQFLQAAAQVKADIQRHLVVAASGGVQALARIPHPAGELLLHKGVNILRLRVDRQLARLQLIEHLPQPADNGVPVGLREYAAAAQHIGVGNAAGNILAEHALIEGDRGIKVVGFLIGGIVIAPSPKFHSPDHPYRVVLPGVLPGPAASAARIIGGNRPARAGPTRERAQPPRTSAAAADNDP